MVLNNRSGYFDICRGEGIFQQPADARDRLHVGRQGTAKGVCVECDLACTYLALLVDIEGEAIVFVAYPVSSSLMSCN
jgi:hypothetical protein